MENTINYEPLGNHIVVEMPDVAKETDGGIIKSEAMLKEERDKRGLVGRNWAIEKGFSHNGMCDAMIESIEGCFKNLKPRKPFELISISEHKEPIHSTGVLIK